MRSREKPTVEQPYWVIVRSVDEMEAFYISKLPAIREAARQCGYAVGLHGSMRRDLDLMAIPWVEPYSTPDALADAIMRAACGFGREHTYWTDKPNGRIATSLPVCWCEWEGVYEIKSIGHIDLSVMLPSNYLKAQQGAK